MNNKIDDPNGSNESSEDISDVISDILDVNEDEEDMEKKNIMLAISEIYLRKIKRNKFIVTEIAEDD